MIRRFEGAGWINPAFALVIAVTLIRWALLAFDRTDLYVDESQYWLWGQHFAFGYYSKPPLIAWLIGAVTTLAGSDATFWVRMPGAALHGATALILAALAARIYSAKTALWVAAAYVTLPMVALGSFTLSTDTVMAPFFAAALYFHRRLIETPLARFALAAGAMAGIGFMAKYAAIYFLIGMAMAALLHRDQRISLRQTVLLLLAFGAVVSPNIIWNLNNHLATLAHTMDNVGWVRQGNPLAGMHLTGPIDFLASQFAVIGPLVFAALLVKLIKPRAEALAGFVYPPLVVVMLQSLLDQAYANWAIAAYFAGTVLAVTALQRRPVLLWLSLAVNGALSLALPVIATTPSIAIGERPILLRYLGRADFSQQIIDLARQNRITDVMAESREILADLFYTGRDSGLAFHAPRPKGRALNHYEETYPLPQGLTEQLLIVAEQTPACTLATLPLRAEQTAYRNFAYAAFVVDAECFNAAH